MFSHLVSNQDECGTIISTLELGESNEVDENDLLLANTVLLPLTFQCFHRSLYFV